MRYRPIIPRYGPVIQPSNHVCHGQLRESPFFQDTFARSGLLTLGDQLVWAQATTFKRPWYDEGRRRPRDVPRDVGRGWYGVGRCWDVGRYGDVSAKLTCVWNVCGCNQHKVGSFFGMRPWKEKEFGNRSLGWFGNIGDVTNRKWTSLWVSSTSITHLYGISMYMLRWLGVYWWDPWHTICYHIWQHHGSYGLGIGRCDDRPHHYLDRQACSEFELLEDVETWVGSVRPNWWHDMGISRPNKVLSKSQVWCWTNSKSHDLFNFNMIWTICHLENPWKPLKNHGQSPEIHGQIPSVFVALNSLRAVRNCTGKSTSASWAGDWAIIQEIWITFGWDRHSSSI